MPDQATPTGLSDNAASGLSYVTLVPAIIFLVVAPYNQNQTVRFHAWQSIFYSLACVVIWIALVIVGLIPLLNLIDVILMPIVGIAFLVIWIILLVNAFNGKRFKLPVIGDLSEKQAAGAGF